MKLAWAQNILSWRRRVQSVLSKDHVWSMRWHLKGFKTWSSLKWRSVSFESTRLWILFFWDESQADWKSKSPSPWKVLNDVSKSTYTAHCACYWVLSQTCAHISSKEIRKHTVFIFMKIIILSKGYIDIRMYLMNTLRYVCVCVCVRLFKASCLISYHDKPFHLSVALPVRISLQPATPCCTLQRGELVLFTRVGNSCANCWLTSHFDFSL